LFCANEIDEIVNIKRQIIKRIKEILLKNS